MGVNNLPSIKRDPVEFKWIFDNKLGLFKSKELDGLVKTSKIQSILMGAASVFDLSGQTLMPPCSRATDAEAIRSDFEQVGSYLHWAMSQEPVDMEIQVELNEQEVQPLLPGILK